MRQGTLDWLTAQKHVTHEQCRLITQQQTHLEALTGIRHLSGELLLDAGWVDKPTLRRALTSQGVGLTADLQTLLPREICHRYHIVPLRQSESTIVIQAATILQESAVAEIAREASEHFGTPITIEVVAATHAHINVGIRKLAGNKNGVVEAMRALEEDADNGLVISNGSIRSSGFL